MISSYDKSRNKLDEPETNNVSTSDPNEKSEVKTNDILTSDPNETTKQEEVNSKDPQSQNDNTMYYAIGFVVTCVAAV